VQVVGEVVAVEPNSITTRSSDGTTTNFVITPATARVGPDVGTTGFTLDQTVTVVASAAAGHPVATAVFDQTAAAGNGAPMDDDS
jgi:hypothetical protein